jgi:hypothetical protein
VGDLGQRHPGEQRLAVVGQQVAEPVVHPEEAALQVGECHAHGRRVEGGGDAPLDGGFLGRARRWGAPRLV